MIDVYRPTHRRRGRYHSWGYTSDASTVFQANTTYNIWSPITFPNLTNVEVTIEGNLSYPTSIQTVQNYVGAANYSGAWIAFTGGSNVTLRGTSDPKRGWIDGHGQEWWDIMQQDNRPYGWLFGNIDTGVIRDIKIFKPIAWNFLTTGSNNLHVYNNTILARSDNASFPFNTDGFSAGETNLLFEYNHVVNGGDCLTVVNGAKNITWRNSYCESSHGLSVGSLGKGGQVSSVENVLFENTTMNRTFVTWRNIIFIDVMFPIYTNLPSPDGGYWDQGVGPRPNASSVNETGIEHFSFENFVGTINDTPGYVEGSCVSDPCWYYVPGATGKEAVIFGLYPDTAMNIVAENMFACTLTGAPAAAMCNAPTITSNVGFVCWGGPYIPTPVGP